MPVKNELNKAASPEKPSLHDFIIAVDRYNTAAVKNLLDSGLFDVAAADKPMETGSTSSAEGSTPLGWVAANGCDDIVQLLLDAGFNIDGKDKWGFTPLMNAISSRYTNTVRLLVVSGASLDEKNIYDLTAVDFAKNGGMEKVFQEAITARQHVLQKEAEADVAKQHALRAAVAAKQDILKADARKFTLKPAPAARRI